MSVIITLFRTLILFYLNSCKRFRFCISAKEGREDSLCNKNTRWHKTIENT